MLRQITLVALIVCSTSAYVVPYEGCLYNLSLYKVNETFSPEGECASYTCVGKNKLQGVGCPSVTVGDRDDCVFIDYDYNFSYPDCCPTYICPYESLSAPNYLL